jgi:hypothetical protein
LNVYNLTNATNNNIVYGRLKEVEIIEDSEIKFTI